jgi:hypothetical protein
VWLAGFDLGRAATGVRDPVWARALVLDDGVHRIGLVVLDLIGHHYTDTLRIRQAVPSELGLDYVAVCSTHNHQGPESIGMWGRYPGLKGRDESWMARVRQAAVTAVRQAAAGLRPARLRVAQAATSAIAEPVAGEHAEHIRGFIHDSRRPWVIDDTLTVLRLEPAEAGRESPDALGTVVVWGSHPEALGDDDGVDDGGRRPDGGRLADSLGTQRMVRGRGHRLVGLPPGGLCPPVGRREAPRRQPLGGLSRGRFLATPTLRHRSSRPGPHLDPFISRLSLGIARCQGAL